MATVPDSALKEMIASVGDSKLRQRLSNIVSGKVTHRIYCDLPKSKQGDNQHPKGQLIGEVYADGTVRTVPDDNGLHWLRSSRKRLDGFLGFECHCSNDSRRSEQEKPDLGDSGHEPTREGLERIYNRIQAKPSTYQKRAGKQKIDGFTVEELA